MFPDCAPTVCPEPSIHPSSLLALERFADMKVCCFCNEGEGEGGNGIGAGGLSESMAW